MVLPFPHRPTNMKVLPALAILCASFSIAAHAQQSPAEVTATQVMYYKFIAEQTCTKALTGKGVSQANAVPACRCAFDVYLEHLSFADWQRAVFYSKTGDRAQEDRIYTQHFPKLKHCQTRPAT